MRKNIFYIISIIGIAIGLTITFILATNSFLPLGIDLNVRDYFYNIRGSKFGFNYYFFRMITEFGFVYILALIILIFGIITKFDRRFFILLFGTIIVWLSNELLKGIIKRDRPFEELRWMSEASCSFPSGHSMTSTFVYSILIYYTIDSGITRNKKIITNVLCILILVLIYISRLVLGVHYFTDVIAGIGYGLFLTGVLLLLDIFLKRKNFVFLRNIVEAKINKK